MDMTTTMSKTIGTSRVDFLIGVKLLCRRMPWERGRPARTANASELKTYRCGRGARALQQASLR